MIWDYQIKNIWDAYEVLRVVLKCLFVNQKSVNLMFWLRFTSIIDQSLSTVFCSQDWGNSCPYEFIGAYKLQYDMSWTPASKLREKEEDLALINRIIQGSQDCDRSRDPFASSITDISHEHHVVD